MDDQVGVKRFGLLWRPWLVAAIFVIAAVHAQAQDPFVGQEGKEAGGIWEEGVEALRATFRSTTIADISRREAEDAGAGMYHI